MNRRSEREPGEVIPFRLDGRGRRVLEALLDNHLLVALVLTFAAVLLVAAPSLLSQDSWLSLVAGREIFEHGLPRYETLTTIPLGRVWTDQQWLAHVIFYGLDRAGGLGLVAVVHALMVAGALGVTILFSRLRGASARMTLVAAVACLLTAPWSWQLRAQSLALPLFALTLGLVATDDRLTRRRTLLVLPVLAVWANVHGSAILGATLVSLAAAVSLLRHALGRGHASLPRHLVYLLAPWACLLASPYGFDLVAYYRLLLVDSPVAHSIQEWKAPRPEGYLLVFFAFALATAAIAVSQRRRLSWFDLAALALTLAGALRSGRGILWFAMAAALLLPLALDGLVHRPAAPPVHRRLGIAIVGVVAALTSVALVAALARSDTWYERAWPARAAAATATAAVRDPRAVVWPSDRYADWLLWKEPALRGRVAWDVRFELLREKELRRIVAFKRARPGWRRVIAEYRVLVLDRTETRRQARTIAQETGAHVPYADHDVIVLVRPA